MLIVIKTENQCVLSAGVGAERKIEGGTKIFELNVRLILSTEMNANALKVISQLNKKIGASQPELRTYHKGGTEAVLTKSISADEWSQAFLAAVTVAQSFGRSWVIDGAAEMELSLITDDFSISGIHWAHLSLIRS